MVRHDLEFIRTQRHRATEFLFFSVPPCSIFYFACKMHLILSLLEHRGTEHTESNFSVCSVPLCSILYFVCKMHLILSLLEHGGTEPQSFYFFSVPPCLCVQSLILLAKCTSTPPESKRTHHLPVFDIVASIKSNLRQLQSSHFHHLLWPIPFPTIENSYSQDAS